MVSVAKPSLGRTGIEIGEFIFGAGAIGGVGGALATRGQGITVQQGLDRLDEAWDLGIRTIDTADSYAGGESERAVGHWLGERRPEGAVVQTKVGVVAEPGGRHINLSKSHIERQLAQSIERLGRVDLYLSHAPDPDTPLAETLEAFASAQDAGLISAFGVSNVDVPLLEALLTTADRKGLPRPGWIQNRMNLLDRSDEHHLLPLVAAEGLGYTPYSPLAGGVLSDRYLDGAEVAPGSRIAVAGELYYQGAYTEANLRRVAALRVLARERAASVSGLALAWLRAHPTVTAPIVSPSTPGQWNAVREALQTEIDEEERSQITALFT